MTEIKKELNIDEREEVNNEKRKLEDSIDVQVNKKCCLNIKQENDILSSNEESNDFQHIDIKEEIIEPSDTQVILKNEENSRDLFANIRRCLTKEQDRTTEINEENGNFSNCNSEIQPNTPKLFNGKDITTLSKSQMKKYQKMLSWEAKKKEKRLKQKMKAKQRKIEARKNNLYTGPTRKELKRSKMSNSTCKTGVIIDLSFDDLMIPKDIGKVIKQILRVYTQNRRSKTPMQIHLTSFDGKSKEEMRKNDGYENWDFYFHQENYIDIFPKEKLVYLSSESDNVITELEQDKFYIIGGLVDHNSHKGLCHKKAVEQGIQHGQLPIDEFFTIKTRKVFTINQVFEILLRVSEGLTFKDAFEKVLPQRINLIPTT